MRTYMYIPISSDVPINQVSEKRIDNSFSFIHMDNIDYNIKLKSGLLSKIQTDFILEFCLCVAIAEAYDVDELIIPINLAYLKTQTDDIEKFCYSLKELAVTGTLRGVNTFFLKPDGTYLEFQNYENSFEGALSNVLNSKITNKTLNIFSGGLDCTVASYYLESVGIKQHYLFYDYGQNNISEERWCVDQQMISRKIEENEIHLNSELKSFFNNIKFSTGLLSNTVITVENKEAEYVPFRNSLFIANALNSALSIDKNISHIVTGSHLDDINSPDNSPNYYTVWNNLVKLSRKYDNFSILPILFKFGGKKEIVKLGSSLNVDFSKTWTCHNTSKSNEIHIQCGICNECKVRRAAFEYNNIIDPLPFN